MNHTHNLYKAILKDVDKTKTAIKNFTDDWTIEANKNKQRTINLENRYKQQIANLEKQITELNNENMELRKTNRELMCIIEESPITRRALDIYKQNSNMQIDSSIAKYS